MGKVQSQQAFPQAAFIANRFALEQMRCLQRAFDSDLERAYVGLAIGCLEGKGSEPSDRRQDVRISAVQTATGLPRETVRRKVHELRELGLIVVNDEGGICLAGATWSRMTGGERLERWSQRLSESAKAINWILTQTDEAALITAPRTPTLSSSPQESPCANESSSSHLSR